MSESSPVRWIPWLVLYPFATIKVWFNQVTEWLFPSTLPRPDFTDSDDVSDQLQEVRDDPGGSGIDECVIYERLNAKSANKGSINEGSSTAANVIEGSGSEESVIKERIVVDGGIEGSEIESSTFKGRVAEGSLIEMNVDAGSDREGVVNMGKVIGGSGIVSYKIEGSVIDGRLSEGSARDGSGIEGIMNNGDGFEGSGSEGSVNVGRDSEGSAIEGRGNEGSGTEGISLPPTRKTWERDFPQDSHVAMPYDLCDLDADREDDQQFTPHWGSIRSALLKEMLFSFDSDELKDAILSYNANSSNDESFNTLYNFSVKGEQNSVFKAVAPKIIQLALSLPDLVRQPLPLLRQGHPGMLTLNQRQVAALLANAFLCAFPQRSVFRPLPNVNFNQLLSNSSPQKIEKLKCIFNYFDRVGSSTSEGGNVSFQRLVMPPAEMPSWTSSCSPLAALDVSSSGSIEVEGDGMLQLDFANKIIGGGVLGNGLVQEEIRFVVNPELIVARLFTEELQDNEALLMIGSECYSKFTGYARSFRFAGNHVDVTPTDASGHRKCAIVAIDATYFRHYEVARQFERSALVREMNKAYVGFLAPGVDRQMRVATGNWGCGVFNGDPRLKALLQLMAASQAGRSLHYFTYGDDALAEDVAVMHRRLVDNAVTVGQLFNKILEYKFTAHHSLYRHLGRWLTALEDLSRQSQHNEENARVDYSVVVNKEAYHNENDADSAVANKEAQQKEEIADSAFVNKEEQHNAIVADSVVVHKEAEHSVNVADSAFAYKEPQDNKEVADSVVANKEAQQKEEVADSVVANKEAQQKEEVADSAFVNKEAEHSVNVADSVVANKKAQNAEEVADSAFENKNALNNEKDANSDVDKKEAQDNEEVARSSTANKEVPNTKNVADSALENKKAQNNENDGNSAVENKEPKKSEEVARFAAANKEAQNKEEVSQPAGANKKPRGNESPQLIVNGEVAYSSINMEIEGHFFGSSEDRAKRGASIEENDGLSSCTDSDWEMVNENLSSSPPGAETDEKMDISE